MSCGPTETCGPSEPTGHASLGDPDGSVAPLPGNILPKFPSRIHRVIWYTTARVECVVCSDPLSGKAIRGADPSFVVTTGVGRPFSIALQ